MRHRRLALERLVVAALLLGYAPRSGGWFGPDRIKHFFISFFVQSASYSVARTVNLGPGPSLAVATATTAAAGVSKEVWDRQRGGSFSRGDLAWDALGAGAATLLLVRAVDD